jgi:hypothetical protein
MSGAGRRLLSALAFALTALAAVGCGSEKAAQHMSASQHRLLQALDGPLCTAMGCSSGVSVDLEGLRAARPEARSVTLCLRGHCHTERLAHVHYIQVLPKDKGGGVGPFVVSVSVRDRHGRQLLASRRAVVLLPSYPSGRACGVACYFRVLGLDVADGALTT